MMPFPGGLEALPNGTLIAAVAAAVLYLLLLSRHPTWLRTIVKTLPAVLLAVLAGIVGGPLLLALGLAFSAAGDALLSREDDRLFQPGVLCFLVAQVVYAVLFYQVGGGAGLLTAEWLRLGVAVVMTVSTLFMLVLLMIYVPASMRPLIFVYVFAILAMGLAALTLDSLWVIAGALLFVFSDTVLAIEKFLMPAINPLRDLMRYVVWITYVLAQLGITLGFVAP
ncbi:MAG: lysoplasmalogenase [Rhizobiaceae bacterium]|nr:lysoplasmalogenase [Rhizobiaceae bacterium]